MKLVVCGGWDERLTEERRLALRNIVNLAGATEIVTGGCRGIDLDAEAWAQENGLKTTTFRPEWDKHGRAAGPLRNAEMAEYADECVAFPGGKGTADMKRQMASRKKKVWLLD